MAFPAAHLLTGHASRTALRGAIRTAVDLAWDIDGVVDIIEHAESAA